MFQTLSLLQSKSWISLRCRQITLINSAGKTKYLFPLPHQKADLHLSKALFSLDAHNLQLHCFLGLGTSFCCLFFCPLDQPCTTLQMMQVTPRQHSTTVCLETNPYPSVFAVDHLSPAKGAITDPWHLILIYVTLRFLQGGGAGGFGLLNSIKMFLWIKIQQFTNRTLQVQLFAHLHRWIELTRC